MISAGNTPINQSSQDDDFTVNHYRQLLRLAKANWKFVRYQNIPWDQSFILWRHDLDYSLNRSLSLAQIEAEEGVQATYFINLHSDFYNALERSQFKIINRILSLGHDLGVHFDASFYDIGSEEDLDSAVAKEADFLENLFGQKPVAFSFHNPVAAHLEYDSEVYGGLLNCYSRTFKTEVSYCSDSNGYWRFGRLHDILQEKKEDRLQILTHPGWWQEKPMPARQRIFRSILGRASAALRAYDSELEHYKRVNQTGPSAALQIFKTQQPLIYEHCDYLWGTENFKALYIELWMLHESQINRLSKVYMTTELRMPISEVNALFASGRLCVDGRRLFEALFEMDWQQACGQASDHYERWLTVRDQLLCARSSLAPMELESGCIYLCDLIQVIAKWGLSQPFCNDGLHEFDLFELSSGTESSPAVGAEKSDTSAGTQKASCVDWTSFLSKLG